MSVVALLLCSAVVRVRAACSGLDEQSCLASGAADDACCVWCGHADSADGKCVSTGAAGTCASALDTHCGDAYDSVRPLTRASRVSPRAFFHYC